MKACPYILLIVLATLAIGGCTLPRITGDGLVSPDDTEFVVNIRRYVDRLVESKGWDEPDVDSGEMWLDLAFWMMISSAASLVAWYLSHWRELGGVAMILGGFSIFCAGMAEIDWLYLVPGVGILGALAYLGYRLKDWNIMKPIKARLAKCQKP